MEPDTAEKETHEDDNSLYQKLLDVASVDNTITDEKGHVLGFQAEKVEDAFQASESKFRAWGVLLIIIATFIFGALTKLSESERMLPLWALVVLFSIWLLLLIRLPCLLYRPVFHREFLQRMALGMSLLLILAWVCILLKLVVHPPEPGTELGIRIGVTATLLPFLIIMLLKPPVWVSAMFSAVASATVSFGFDHASRNLVGSIGPAFLLCFLFFCTWYLLERNARSNFLAHIHALQTIVKTRAAENSAFHAVNHCAKRVMHDNLHWCSMIKNEITPCLPQDNSAVEKLAAIVSHIEVQNNQGFEKCKSSILRQQIASGTYEKVKSPVALQKQFEETWASHPHVKCEVKPSVPEWLMLPAAVLMLILDSAVHNATTHGQEEGPLRLSAEVSSEARLCITLRNEAGENHAQALQLQDEQGRNFLFTRTRASLADLGSSRSTYLKRQEILDVARVMDATVELLFVAGTESDTPHTTFTLTTELQVPEVVPDASSPDSLPPGSVLICADDDYMPRIGYKGLIKRLKPAKSLILGETYEEVKRLPTTVLDLAKEYGDENVVCIFDQNMDRYDAGLRVFGTDVVREVRKAGFRGCILIRSANDEPTMQQIYMQAGANGCLGKNNRNLNALVSDVMQTYRRAVQMNM